MHDWPEAQLLETTRLLLEPLTVQHAPEMLRVLADPTLYRYIGGSAPTEDELTERYIRQSVGQSPDGEQGWMNWVIRRRDTGDAIGFSQATLTRSAVPLTGEIAWLIAPVHQSNGFATEAARRMCEWLCEQGITTFVAHIHPNNRPSAGVAQKLGLHATDIVVDGEVRWERTIL